MRDVLNFFKNTAEKYLSAGLCVLPASRTAKSPRVGKWSVFKKRLPTQTEINAWFANRHDAVCIVCGGVSGNLELLDFDDKAGLFDDWKEKISDELFEKLVIELTQSGGKHVFYRCESKVCGNIKLAQKRIDLSDEEIIRHKGKEYVWHNGKKYQVSVDEDGVMYFVVTQIETRGEGGLFLCDPTDGYEIVQGSFENLPVISESQRNLLLTAAWELNSHVPAEQVRGEESHKAVVENSGTRPGDEFNVRGDHRGLLEKHGWVLVSCSSGNEYWRRPGKEGKSWSASYSFDKGVFYVFSSNAQPFEAGKGYSLFSVYALLEHDGDFTQAAKELHKYGYGTPQDDFGDVDISKILDSSKNHDDPDKKWYDDITESIDMRNPPILRKSIIKGFLREGEIMNVIAAPKTGKSWLASDLGLAIARGGKWLGTYECAKCPVLLIDNELHDETLFWRIYHIVKTRDIDFPGLKNKFHTKRLRGELLDIHGLAKYFNQLKPNELKVIILDAFYRFLPPGSDENDNALMAYLYNRLDQYAKKLNCAFILVHHTSKGQQAGKAVTDVGSGAGSLSRATDTHVILRKHREKKTIVLDGAVRSSFPVEPVCLSWKFPVWNFNPDLDPEDLEGAAVNRKRKDSAGQEFIETARKHKTVDAATLVETCFDDKDILKRTEIVNRASEFLNIGETRANELLVKAREQNLLYFWKPEGEKYLLYSMTQKPPQED